MARQRRAEPAVGDWLSGPNTGGVGVRGVPREELTNLRTGEVAEQAGVNVQTRATTNAAA